MLRTRIFSAVIFGPIVILFGYLGHPWLTILCAVALALGAKELAELGKGAGHQACPALAAGLASLPALERGFLNGRYFAAVLAGGLVVAAIIHVLLAAPGKKTFEGWATTIAAICYVGFLGSYLVALRALPHGVAWLGLAVITVWVSDTGAYFVGRAWGRRPLAPYLSPKKTWEGALGGFLSAVACAGVFILFSPLSLHQCLAVGLLVGTLCPFGDLAISMLKRQVGVKDTGTLIPGHGGVLDRLDTLLFAAPLTYFVAALA